MIKHTVAAKMLTALGLGLTLAVGAAGAPASAADITLLSREEGSGTRGAFVELFGLQEKRDGQKYDLTSERAEITNSTAVMTASVADDPQAIGYISLGSLNDTVKALQIDGVAPSAATVKDGSYRISRPFLLIPAPQAGELSRDFLDFVLSSQGQAVVEKAGYIGVGTPQDYRGSGHTGKIVIAGSSSVTPAVEKLKEAYLGFNPGADVEVQMNDSTTGITAAQRGICDLGMSSRPLTDSELQSGLKPTVIATDGIAVIVNRANPRNNAGRDQIKDVYRGQITAWEDLKE